MWFKKWKKKVVKKLLIWYKKLNVLKLAFFGIKIEWFPNIDIDILNLVARSGGQLIYI
jgi:hypothetical protein